MPQVRVRVRAVKICAYVLSAYAKQTYAVECHDVRAWHGFEVVLHAARAAGHHVEYAGEATVHEYDVVLVSITSDCDWWPLLAEMRRWRRRDGRLVVAGGAGVLNVRPFLGRVGAFVLGRGEAILPALLTEHEAGRRLHSDSVVWADEFAVERSYRLAQAAEPYPHDVLLTNGRVFREGSIGCPMRCFFCGYTWHRRYIGDGTFSAGSAAFGQHTERTLADLLALPPERWCDAGPVRIVGLDGMSERLRLRANKRITREMLREFLRGLATLPKPNQIKIYSILGYPAETEDDWAEFAEDLAAVDSQLSPSKQWSLLVHVTPFRAMPATPSATWQMSAKNYRGALAKTLKKPSMPGNVFYQGRRFWAVEGMGTDSLPTVVQSALCLRGTERDADMMERLAASGKYWRADMTTKLATLEKHADIDELFRGRSQADNPTRYLKLERHA
jgi:hypothetical protein